MLINARHACAKCVACTRPGNAQTHETRPTALSTSTRQILDAGLAEAAAAFPAPRPAARLAALTPLLPSPNIGQVELIFDMYGASPGQIGIQFAIQHPFSRSSIQITSHSAFDAPRHQPELPLRLLRH
ncbi:hypothetical protein B0H14DRAFT_3859882 [Mycena olivaceomarginata]|nr:hypothetical protein B0H14DRAFT_3859882 [Mycena olivaceomarginata]